jgi:hypothetical protein
MDQEDVVDEVQTPEDRAKLLLAMNDLVKSLEERKLERSREAIVKARYKKAREGKKVGAGYTRKRVVSKRRKKR